VAFDPNYSIKVGGHVQAFGSSGELLMQVTEAAYTVGTALTNTAATTVTRMATNTSYLLAGTMSQNETITYSAVGAVAGDRIRTTRTSTSAFTAAFVNGGAGGGTFVTLPASKAGFVEAVFDGTNWLLSEAGSV